GAARPPSPRGEPAGRQQGCGPQLTGHPLTTPQPFGLFAPARSHHVTNTSRRAPITLCDHPRLIKCYIIHVYIVALACYGPNKSPASGIPLWRQRTQPAAWLIERDDLLSTAEVNAQDSTAIGHRPHGPPDASSAGAPRVDELDAGMCEILDIPRRAGRPMNQTDHGDLCVGRADRR